MASIPGLSFCMIHGAWEILQDHSAWRGGEAVLERLNILAAAATNVHEEVVALAFCCGPEAIEDLLLYGEPVGEVGTVLAACCHEDVEVVEGLGVFFNVLPEGEIRVEGEPEGYDAGIGGAFTAVFLKVGG